ncbi:molybdopterin converting factor subunit 1 [Thiohalobacter sp. IOR34]|uniref:molybdopterin converting factor subunit 1 n=1 Tax=Thiohalobacter sp. IOR34 TaxID=3057176 RepID=UPI0025B07793|nr:molybdopterin converting factor subunit 1 [Thiohalobacter sp. IOR34]WJW75244.1 molybdopterin converting factor subunit 1 [Thiohalobacter sp. IOR34]
MSMKLRVRFFASLREQTGQADTEVEVEAGARVADVWAAAVPDQPRPPNLLAARNMEYVDFDAPVAEGDEVAFFPPVTGG